MHLLTFSHTPRHLPSCTSFRPSHVACIPRYLILILNKPPLSLTHLTHLSPYGFLHALPFLSPVHHAPPSPQFTAPCLPLHPIFMLTHTFPSSNSPTFLTPNTFIYQHPPILHTPSINPHPHPSISAHTYTQQYPTLPPQHPFFPVLLCLPHTHTHTSLLT